MYSSVSAIPQTIDVATRRFYPANVDDADTTPDALIGTTAKQISLSGYGVAIRRPGIRTNAPSSTTRISQATAQMTSAGQIGSDSNCHCWQVAGKTICPSCGAQPDHNAMCDAAGQVYDTVQKKCVPKTVNPTPCPAGTTKDVLSGACVANTGNTGGGTSGGATTPPPASTTTSGWVTAAVAIVGLLAVAGRIGR